jgi:hypothetical protein
LSGQRYYIFNTIYKNTKILIISFFVIHLKSTRKYLKSMKKSALILVTFITFFSCGKDVQFNNPAFEGLRNGEFLWRASSYSVSFGANGFLTISGSNGSGNLSFTIPGASVGTYVFGNVDATKATYQEDNISYSTIYDGSGGPGQLSEGEVIIEEIDFINKTFTGSFKFNAYSENGEVAVNFSGYQGDRPETTNQEETGGIFYKLPLTSGDFPSVILTCTDTQAASQITLGAFQATFMGVDIVDADAYQIACMDYLQALENQQAYCGDATNAIQTIIENLGDCSMPCNLAEANSAFNLQELNNATIGQYINRCNAYATSLQEQITICGDEDGAIQILLDRLDCSDDDGDGVPNKFEDTNDDGDYTNDDTDNDGTPDYQDTDDDNDGLSTMSELELDVDGNAVDTDGDAAANYLDRDDDNDSIDTINESGDTDSDGVLDYLDEDDDGDGVFTIFENPDMDANGNPSDAQDTDGNGTADYLDTDDDGDGLLTQNENADPNGDGNPDDAVDTDMDTIPDYLDNM